jgi:hypothetical protein
MTSGAEARVEATDWRDANRRCLEGELERLRLLLERRVLWLRRHWALDAEADLGGLAISDAQAERLLAGGGREAEARFHREDDEARRIGDALAERERELETRRARLREAGTPAALDAVTRLFGLDGFEREVLVLALAPELDGDFGRLYAYAQDDATAQHPTLHLAAALFGSDPLDAAHRLRPSGPLRWFQLLAPGEGPSRSRMPLRLTDRITDYLQGFNQLDPPVSRVLQPLFPAPPASSHAGHLEDLQRWLAASLARGEWPRLHLIAPSGAGRRAFALELCRRLGLGVYRLRPAALREANDQLPALLERESALLQFALYLEVDEVGPEELQRLDDLLGRLRALLLVAGPDALDTDWPLLRLPLPRPDRNDQRTLWSQVLAQIPNTVDGEIEAIAEHFDFGPSMIAHAARQALGRARLREGDGPVGGEDLWRACREHSVREIGRLAERIVSSYTWDDIVLPPDTLDPLREIATQVANRHRVYGDWGFGAKLSRGRGISALFSGAAGTGKTMAAEILAHHLDLDLYRIDLSRVVNKYIGETEKNLARVFDAAERSGAILFFDEADALFGKRTEVRDSHDRYANIEIDYLLQRMEEYRGLAILATNMKSLLDQAFLRRLRFLVDFPLPGPAERRSIWTKSIPPAAPVGELRFDQLERLEITGGNIRNIVLNAAFLAAGERSAIGMEHVMRAARREYAKEEKLMTRGEFGGHLAETPAAGRR